MVLKAEEPKVLLTIICIIGQKWHEDQEWVGKVLRGGMDYGQAVPHLGPCPDDSSSFQGKAACILVKCSEIANSMFSGFNTDLV